MASKVFFTKEITPEKVVELYKALGIELPGKVACKVHTGEEGNQNYIHPEFWKPMVDYVNGTIVECNTAYGSSERITTDQHKKVIKDHGWDSYFNVDIMDGEGPDLEVPVENGFILKSNLLGKDIKNYDSMLVLAHYKGHPSGGYGGALKQLSIGCASASGKALIHSGGVNADRYKTFDFKPAKQEVFLESMADAASTVVKMFENKIAFVSVMKNMSVDCDCVGFGVACPPEIEDFGMLASLDPVAIDQACFDLLCKHPNPKRTYLIDRINSRNGLHTIDCAAKLGYGTKEYELIEL